MFVFLIEILIHSKRRRLIETFNIVHCVNFKPEQTKTVYRAGWIYRDIT